MNERVKQILSWYRADNPGVLNNLARMMMHGQLANTGKFVILPVDQGFEHGPTRSFAANQAGYDPSYHFKLAIASGCNAYAAPLGFLESYAAEFAGQIPLILKVNNSDSIAKSTDPCPAITASVKDALRIGACAIGYTIYPGSAQRNSMYQDLRALIEEARGVGLPTVLWAYPRGSALSKQGETAIDVVAYAAHISAQLGAHLIKVKPPQDYIESVEAKKVFEKYQIPTQTLSDRIKHVVQSAFSGQRIVIFSGGETKATEDVLNEIRQIHQGGGFGSIVGRNAFQRPQDQAIELLQSIMHIYRE